MAAGTAGNEPTIHASKNKLPDSIWHSSIQYRISCFSKTPPHHRMRMNKYSFSALTSAMQASLLAGMKILLSIYLLFIITVGGLYNILAPFDEAPDYHRVFLLIEQFPYPIRYYISNKYPEIVIYYSWAVFDIIAAGLALLMLWRPFQTKNKWLLWLPFIANTSIFFYFCLIMYRVL